MSEDERNSEHTTPTVTTGQPEMTEEEFQDLYGPWEPLVPLGVRDLFDGAPFRWWMAGGWAVDAASGISRHHDDTDVAVLRSDVDEIRVWLSDYHQWEINDGSLRPRRPDEPLKPDSEQIWLRRNSRSPWIMDLLLTPSEGNEWLFKRDHRIRLPLAEIGFTGANGVSYLRPEVVLLHKARLNREKDRRDLDTLLPALPESRRRWLADALVLLTPDHPWLPRLALSADRAG